MSNKITFDDGFNSEFVETAFFDGIFEIPTIKKNKELIIPKRLIPFSKRNTQHDKNDFLTFYEHDIKFADLIRDPGNFLDIVESYGGIVTPDNSLYYDSPLTVQISNVYRSRAIGCYFQSKGIYVIPNVRWGDERSYSKTVFNEEFAFLGIPKKGIVCIGTYGACKTNENKYHLKNGLISMLDSLEPEVVLVYGAMSNDVFDDIKNKAIFIRYPDWISKKRGEK